MRLKISSLLSATALLALAACESAQDDSAEIKSSGAGSAPIVVEQATIVPGSAADFVKNAGDRVFFDFDKSSIRADGQSALKRQAEWLKKYPNVTVTIQGHCDERGTTEYNLALGERRASAAKEALMALGIPDARIKIISYGKERPIVEGHDDAAYAENRVAITVID